MGSRDKADDRNRGFAPPLRQADAKPGAELDVANGEDAVGAHRFRTKVLRDRPRLSLAEQIRGARKED